MKVAVTVLFPVIVTVQGFAGPESQFNQFPKVEGLIGVAVRVIIAPLWAWARHGAVLAQLKPGGELVTVPAPFPAKVRVSTGNTPPPELVKQTTLPVM